MKKGLAKRIPRYKLLFVKYIFLLENQITENNAHGLVIIKPQKLTLSC